MGRTINGCHACFVRQSPRSSVAGHAITFLSAAVLGAAVLGLGSPLSAKADVLTPESAEVKAAIAKGIAFLETQPGGSMGVQSLVGLTLAKSGAKHDHPQIKAAIAAVQASVAGGPEKVADDIYSTGVAIMFLVAVDPKQYRYDIEKLVQSLHFRQKTDGAWGYPVGSQTGGKTCDTSMTQFACLGLYEASVYAEVPTPSAVWDKVAAWLVKSQDPTGGYGYQGKVSSYLGERVKQDDTLHSMTMAGLCSVYICRDQLGLSQIKKSADDDTPRALKPVESQEEAKTRAKTALDPKLIAKARGDGNRWVNEHFTIDKPKGWLHYYLYALERYETIREAEGSISSKTNWYHQGARLLLETQKENGSWEGNAGLPPETCFCVLFLLRSMKKSLDRSYKKYPEGILIGGRGMPKTGEVRLRRGQVAAKPGTAPLAELLQKLTPAHADQVSSEDAAQALEALQDLAETGAAAIIDEHAEVLRELASSESPQETRLAAARALGRSRNLDYAPVLIACLEDGELDLLMAARDGLVGISRRADAFGFDVRSSRSGRKDAIDKWKAWYRALRPDAELD